VPFAGDADSREETIMAAQSRYTGMLVLGTLALLLAAPLLAAPPAPPPQPTMVLQVGDTGLTTFAYSPDGRTLATGGDHGVRLWDTASGQLKVIRPAGAVSALAFAPGGESLATGSVDDNGNAVVQLWDLANGQLKSTLEPGLGYINSLAFSPDGQTLATGGGFIHYSDFDVPYTRPGPVQLWDVGSGLLKTGFDGAIGAFAFAPDGKTLATGDGELWDVATGQLKATLDGATGPLGPLAFSPDGRILATTSADGMSQVQLWDVASRQVDAILRGHQNDVASLAFSPDGRTLASGGVDATARLWDVASGQLRATLQGHSDTVTLLAFAPNGQTLATGSSIERLPYMTGGVLVTGDGTLRLWDVASGQLKAILDGRKEVVSGVALSPDGRTLAAEDGVGVRLWNVTNGQLKATLPYPFASEPNARALLVFSPDSQKLATVCFNASSELTDGTARLWDVASGQLKATVLTGYGFVSYGLPPQVAFSPDSTTLATWGELTWAEDTVRLWDAASGQLRATLTGAELPLAYSPDGQTLATAKAYEGEGVELWDAPSGQLKATLPGPPVWVDYLVFSPDGTTLTTGYRDGTVRLSDVASGQLKATLTDAGGPVFSPDSKTLATQSGDWNVRLWDVPSGQLKATLKDAYGPPPSSMPGWSLLLVFSPDSRTLATQDYSPTTDIYTVQLWDVAGGQLRATLQSGAGARGADAGLQLAFSPDSKTLATRDAAGHLHLWDVASAGPITITAQTSLARFPPWLTHPFSWSSDYPLVPSPEVSLLDPVDEHVMATMQALPDAPASLFSLPPDPAAAPPTGGNWITTTPDGYFEGSANLAPFVRWSVDGVLYPAAAYWDVYYRPDLVQQALKIPGE
jgi:WD40 repeat protein